MEPQPAPITPTDYADPAFVRAIAARAPDNGARNADITRSYFEIGRRLRTRLGTHNADWATTAAWASGAVGLIIREQEGTHSGVFRVAKGLSGSLYTKLVKNVRANLEEGNRQVYSELGLAFAELAQMCCGRVSWTDTERDEFLGRLPSGRRSVAVRWQDKTDLRPAFECYLRAMTLDDRDPDERKLKSELMFAANVWATASEQAGLQPYINGAFEGVALMVSRSTPLRLPVVRGFSQVFAYATQALVQRVVTEFGIKVVIGEDALSVGRPLAPVGGHLWSRDLRTLRSAEAKDAWATYGRGADDGRGTEAADWTLMDDRMNYITCFFRARQQDPRLQVEPAHAAEVPAE
jgi:hypothetical protein